MIEVSLMVTNAHHYYTVDEVATLLKVHSNTVRGWIKQGKLKAIKISTLTRIKEVDLETFMKPFADVSALEQKKISP